MQISPYQMHNEHSVNVGDKKCCGQKRDCMCDKLDTDNRHATMSRWNCSTQIHKVTANCGHDYPAKTRK